MSNERLPEVQLVTVHRRNKYISTKILSFEKHVVWFSVTGGRMIIYACQIIRPQLVCILYLDIGAVNYAVQVWISANRDVS